MLFRGPDEDIWETSFVCTSPNVDDDRDAEFFLLTPIYYFVLNKYWSGLN